MTIQTKPKRNKKPPVIDQFTDLVALDRDLLPPITEGLLTEAIKLAAHDPDFHAPRGAGEGDHHTNRFMRNLNAVVAAKWPDEVSIEHRVSDIAKWNVDFYVRSEATIIEIALSSRNPHTELEKDIFKALVGRENGLPIERLVLLGKSAFEGKAGTVARLNNPAALVTRDFVRRQHSLAIIIREFPKEDMRP